MTELFCWFIVDGLRGDDVTTRYYKVTDENILKTFSDYYAQRIESQKKADVFGEKYGLGEGGFKVYGMWMLTLVGFECSWFTHSKLKNKELWTQPKDGYTRPKVKKGSAPHEEFKNLCRGIYINSSEIEGQIGFNHMDFFPQCPGYQYIGNKNLMIFKMPESCESVKGCIEISNIEYIKECN